MITGISSLSDLLTLLSSESVQVEFDFNKKYSFNKSVSAHFYSHWLPLVYTVQRTLNANENSFKNSSLHIEIMPNMDTILVFMAVNTHTCIINGFGSVVMELF